MFKMLKNIAKETMRYMSFFIVRYLKKLKENEYEHEYDTSSEVGIIKGKTSCFIRILSFFSLYSFNSKDVAFIISNRGHIIKISHDGTNMIEHRMGTTCVKYKQGKYVYVPRDKNDKILSMYGISFGMEGYIVKLIDDALCSVYGVTFDGKIKEYTIDDFVTKHGRNSFRVLQAPIVALYALSYYSIGLKELGYDSDYMVSYYSASDFSFLEKQPDFMLQQANDKKSEQYFDGRKVEFLIYALSHYDIFHVHSNCSLFFGSSFWGNNSDLPYLKKMGKKVVQSYWGYCDNRRMEDPSGGVISECDVCRQLRPVCCENKAYNKLISRSLQYSDVMLTNARAVTQYGIYKWMDNPIDLKRYSFSYKDIPKKYRLENNGKIKIYHSFGNATKRDDVKGTKFIIEAVNRLEKEGYNVELIYINDVQHSDIRYYQAQADIVVDQLYCGWYGSTGAECLSLGKIVITYVNPDVANYVEKNLGRELPVVSATTNTIYDVLKDILDNPDKYEVYKTRARKFAEQYHDYRVVASELLSIYKGLFN